MGLHRLRPEFVHGKFEFIVDVEFQLQAFRTYIKTTEDLIEHELKDQLSAYEKIMKEEYETYIETGFDFREYDILLQTQRLYYTSIVISLYSFLEKKMVQLCMIAEQKTSVKFKQVKGTGIFKCYDHLKLCSSIDFALIDQPWQSIKALNKIRNNMVHDPTAYDAVEIDKKFLLDHLSVISRFLNDLCYYRVTL